MADDVFRPNAAANVKRGDLRDIQHARCGACGFAWVAPVINLCPRCRAAGATVTERLMIGAPRV